MVAGEGVSQGERNIGAETAGPLWQSEVSIGVGVKGNYVTHYVKDTVANVCQQGLFLNNPN